MEEKFYVCNHCGNMIGFVKKSGVPVVCCGKPMVQLVAGAVDAAAEKHVPVVTQDDHMVTVRVGSVDHPMSEEHFIEWISLETQQGNQRKELLPGAEPKVVFGIAGGDKVVAAYAYCNLHGLWKLEV